MCCALCFLSSGEIHAHRYTLNYLQHLHDLRLVWAFEAYGFATRTTSSRQRLIRSIGNLPTLLAIIMIIANGGVDYQDSRHADFCTFSILYDLWRPHPIGYSAVLGKWGNLRAAGLSGPIVGGEFS